MLAALLLPSFATALIFASPDSEPDEAVPPDFPYWEHVTQRRYEGPTVIYLGAGHALTARHVGQGEIAIGGTMYAPVSGSKRTLLNAEGSAADVMIFELVGTEAIDLPILPITREPVAPGEEVLLVGFGRLREKVVEWRHDGEPEFGFRWTKKGAKRWGTNRVESSGEILAQGHLMTRAIAFAFDEPFSPRATRYEAQAALGDSGGGVFALRDGEWQLAALMVSVSGRRDAPGALSVYQDVTFAADLSHYRSEILRWTRPACANERDDDGDERVDYPLDPGCDSETDADERDGGGSPALPLLIAIASGAAILVVIGALVMSRRRS